MVIEVKKNLYSKELSDAYENLKSVVNIQKDNFRSIKMNMIKDEYCWLASYRRKPMILILELLWTRLTY